LPASGWTREEDEISGPHIEIDAVGDDVRRLLVREAEEVGDPAGGEAPPRGAEEVADGDGVHDVVSAGPRLEAIAVGIIPVARSGLRASSPEDELNKAPGDGFEPRATV